MVAIIFSPTVCICIIFNHMFLTDLDNIEAYTIYIFYSKEDMKIGLKSS